NRPVAETGSFVASGNYAPAPDSMRLVGAMIRAFDRGGQCMSAFENARRFFAACDGAEGWAMEELGWV
ncbi:MAG: hypothetical protein OXE40_08660, partial [Gammaproteobacteria bacterium]|nr:hypothetical protein [Gammaproteobacteria bacterium]